MSVDSNLQLFMTFILKSRLDTVEFMQEFEEKREG